MRETKLIKLLQKLPEKELKDLDKFVHAPYLNSNQSVLKLWEYIRKYAPDFEHKRLDKVIVFKKMFPGKRINDTKLRQLRSVLLQLVEQFLVVEQLNKDKFQYDKQLANAYLELEMKEAFEKKQKELIEKFPEDGMLETSELQQKLNLHHQLYFSEFNVKGDQYPEELAKCTQLLEQYYTRQKLLYTIEWISLSKRYSYQIPDIILNYCESLKKTENKPTIINLEMLEQSAKLLLLEGKQANEVFDKVKQQFEANYKVINKTEKNLILRLLLNFCIGKGDSGNSEAQDMFQLYQLGLSDESIFYKGLMTNVTFINIVATALKLEKKKWTSNFIQNEKWRLYEPQKKLYLSIGEATLAFYKEEYQDCLEILSKMDSTDLTTMEIAKRGLKLRATFECYLLNQSYSKMLISTIESDTKFISRKMILSDKKRESYRNFVNSVLKLTKWLDNKYSLSKLNIIKINLVNLEPFPSQSKIWLLNHIKNWETKMELPEQLQDS